jgi:hypothetical protein
MIARGAPSGPHTRQAIQPTLKRPRQAKRIIIVRPTATDSPKMRKAKASDSTNAGGCEQKTDRNKGFPWATFRAEQRYTPSSKSFEKDALRPISRVRMNPTNKNEQRRMEKSLSRRPE